MITARRCFRRMFVSNARFRFILAIVVSTLTLGGSLVDLALADGPTSVEIFTRSGEPVEARPTFDSGLFKSRNGPREDDGVGKFKFVAYCGPLADKLTKEQFIHTSPQKSHQRIRVQIDEYPLDYEFMKHDFYAFHHYAVMPSKRGLLSSSHRRSKEQTEGLEKDFSFLQITQEKKDTPSIICSSLVEDNNWGQGTLGWYSINQDKFIMVTIRYGGLSGVPVGFINEYLSKYPSQNSLQDPEAKNWRISDVRKWSTLLKSRASDERVRAFAQIQLYKHTGQIFGLDKLPARQANDPEWPAHVSKMVTRIEQWIVLNDKQ